MMGIAEWVGWNWILLVGNAVLAVISGIGAYKSLKYFHKSRNLRIYTQSNEALIEIGNMLKRIPRALIVSNPRLQERGTNISKTLSEIGESLNLSYNEVLANIPQDYLDEFRKLQKIGGFDIQMYFNSLMSGEAINEDGVNRDEYDKCQKILVNMQTFLKKRLAETEERLK